MQFGPDNAEYGDVNSAMGMQRHYRVMAGAVSLRSRESGQPAMENKIEVRWEIRSRLAIQTVV